MFISNLNNSWLSAPIFIITEAIITNMCLFRYCNHCAWSEGGCNWQGKTPQKSYNVLTFTCGYDDQYQSIQSTTITNKK